MLKIRTLSPLLLASLLVLLPVGSGCGGEEKGDKGKEKGAEKGGDKGKAAAAGPPRAFQQAIDDQGASTVREAGDPGKKGFLMTEALELEVNWETTAGTIITPAGDKAVTATGNKATTRIDLLKLIGPKLTGLETEEYSRGYFKFTPAFTLEVGMSRAGSEETGKRVLTLRMDDALAWILKNTVAKGKPLLAPGEAAARSGKRLRIAVGEVLVDARSSRDHTASPLFVSGGGKFTDFDFVEFDESVDCGKKKRAGTRATMYDRRTGKKVGDQVFVYERCSKLKGSKKASPRAFEKWRKKVMK